MSVRLRPDIMELIINDGYKLVNLLDVFSDRYEKDGIVFDTEILNLDFSSCDIYPIENDNYDYIISPKDYYIYNFDFEYKIKKDWIIFDDEPSKVSSCI